MADAEDTTTVEPNPEVETQARGMGWRPKDEFKGEEGKWVDASTFVERGEHVLPIIKETNKRLRTDLQTTHEKLGRVEQALLDSQETIKALEKYHQEDVKQKVEKARKDLKAQLVAAKKSGDVETEVELTEELANLNAADTAATTRDSGNGEDKTTVTTRKQEVDYTQNPEFIEWKEDNPWFSDPVKAAIAGQVTIALRNGGNKLVGRAFLDEVSKSVTKELSRLGGGRRESKVEGSRGGAGGNGGGGSGRTWADLPKEAKDACDGFNNTLVGKGRRHETVDAWRKAYVEQYFREV